MKMAQQFALPKRLVAGCPGLFCLGQTLPPGIQENMNISPTSCSSVRTWLWKTLLACTTALLYLRILGGSANACEFYFFPQDGSQLPPLYKNSMTYPNGVNLPTGYVGTFYRTNIGPTAGYPPGWFNSLTLAGGTLPPGLILEQLPLTNAVALVGTPQTAGTFTFMIAA